MEKIAKVVTLGIIFNLLGIIYAQNATLTDDWSYCYEFTWIGPDYSNVSGYNNTCDDFLDETRAGDNIPCIPPIVVSNDSTIPDLNYLWDNHRQSVLCIRSPNQACVKYSYIYNGIVANQTHMCARVQSSGKGKVTAGCYTQKQGGFDVELCVCETKPGLSKPCNGAGLNNFTLSVGLVCFLILYVLRW